MVFGVGCDIIEINRIENAIKSESFINKYFSVREIEIFRAKKMKSETIAGNFAAKEAVVKAMGTGFCGFEACNVEVLRDKLGAPFVVLEENALALANKKGITSIQVSISHCKQYAMAYAVAEGGKSI